MTEIQKKKIKDERILKLKKIGFWSLNIFCYICSFLFIILLIISLATPKSSNKTSPKNVINQIQYRLDSSEIESEEVNYPIYDDVNNTITFTSDQLNTWYFNNLKNVINNNELQLTDSEIVYDDNTYNLEEIIHNDSISYQNNDYETSYIITFDLVSNLNSKFFYLEDSEPSEFTNFAHWYIDANQEYLDIKTAIQADVLANQPQDYPIYDDSTYSITLNSAQLNNYSWNYLKSYVDGLTLSNLTSVGSGFEYDTYDGNSIKFLTTEGHNYLRLLDNSNSEDIFAIYFNFNGNGEWSIGSQSDPTIPGNDSFEYDLKLVFLSDYYSAFKTVIHSDVISNIALPSIFESITQTITNFLNTLNQGVESVVNLFWDSSNNQLTTLGGLIVIVIGCAISFFLFRLLIGLIRLRG